MTKNNKKDIIDLAMDNLRKNGVRKEDTLEYLIESGKTVSIGILTDNEKKLINETEISRHSAATQFEVHRIYIRKLSKECVDGLDTNKLGDILVDCYNSRQGNREYYKIIQQGFDLDKETAKRIVDVVMNEAAILTDWTINKDRGATYFTIFSPNNPKYDGQEFPIDDIGKYMPFIINNNACPEFHMDKKKSEEIRKQIHLIRH